MHFIDRRVLLITGKGGVGRTTVTVALAQAAARHRRVLVAEIAEGPSAIGRLLGRSQLGPEPVEVSPNLWANQLRARTGHEDFLRTVLPSRTLIRAALRSKAVGKFLIAAPSFHEMGIFYHLLELLQATRADGSPRFELMVVDMPATGHALALTGLPEILLRLIPSGPISRAMVQGQSILNNPKSGAAWVVSLPEQLPTTEAIELMAGLEDTGMPIGGVLLNRMPHDPFDAAERDALEGWLDEHELFGELEFRRIGRAQEALERLGSAVDEPVLTLPEVATGDPVETLRASLTAHMEAS